MSHPIILMHWIICSSWAPFNSLKRPKFFLIPPTTIYSREEKRLSEPTAESRNCWIIRGTMSESLGALAVHLCVLTRTGHFEMSNYNWHVTKQCSFQCRPYLASHSVFCLSSVLLFHAVTLLIQIYLFSNTSNTCC